MAAKYNAMVERVAELEDENARISSQLTELLPPKPARPSRLLRGKDDSVCAVHAPKVAEEVATEAPAAADVPAANQKAPAAAAAPAKAAPKKK